MGLVYNTDNRVLHQRTIAKPRNDVREGGNRRRESVIMRSGGTALHPLDILFWTCLFMGGGYTLFTLLMGGFSHAVGHAAHLGDALHLQHIPELIQHHGGVGGHAGHAGNSAHAGPSGHAGESGHASHAHSAHDHGNHHAQGEGESARFNLFQYMNPLSVAGFLLGFGGAGIASGLLFPALAHSIRLLIGGLSGWGLWLVAYLIVTRLFGGAEGSSHNLREDCIGIRARVNAPIDGIRPGMISYVVGGTRQSLRAVTEDDDPIPVGAEVRIRRISENTAHVMRIDAPEEVSLRIE
jgi:membrane protein implicated in regulation of membrane protease activity